MQGLTELRIQLAQGIAKLNTRLSQQDVSIFLLQKAVAALLNPENPESAFQHLLMLDKELAKVEVHLRDSHELQDQIRKLQEQAWKKKG
jgi:hypothetical protein